MDYAHSLGLGFGLYGCRGSLDCAGNPGNMGHIEADANYYAKMGIDWYDTLRLHIYMHTCLVINVWLFEGTSQIHVTPQAMRQRLTKNMRQ